MAKKPTIATKDNVPPEVASADASMQIELRRNKVSTKSIRTRAFELLAASYSPSQVRSLLQKQHPDRSRSVIWRAVDTAVKDFQARTEEPMTVDQMHALHSTRMGLLFEVALSKGDTRTALIVAQESLESMRALAVPTQPGSSKPSHRPKNNSRSGPPSPQPSVVDGTDLGDLSLEELRQMAGEGDTDYPDGETPYGDIPETLNVQQPVPPPEKEYDDDGT